MLESLLIAGLLIGGTEGSPSAGPRAVRVVVSDADGAELPFAALEVCEVAEGSPAEVDCKSLVVGEGGAELRLSQGHRFVVRAVLSGYLSTTVGPIVVDRGRQPADRLLIVLNEEIQESAAGDLR